MELSQKTFSELTSLMSSMAKTLKNFDDRLDQIEENVSDLGETVTVELPKVIAEQVGTAVDAAVAENTTETAEATADATTPATETTEVVDTEVCPTCGNAPCTCEEGAATEEGTEFCGDSESFEEFSEKVTTCIEDLAHAANDIAERVNKMFVKVFSEGDGQINDVTEDEQDVKVVEEQLKEDPKKVVAEEEPQITAAATPTEVTKTEVVVANVNPAPAPVTAEEEKKQFSDRYKNIKGILNL